MLLLSGKARTVGDVLKAVLVYMEVIMTFVTWPGCKESRVRQLGASGFCDQAGEFCA